MATLKKKNKNTSFVLSVCLMIALIAALLVPTTIAWFTDSSVGKFKTVIRFGRVDVELGETVTITSSKDINYVLPGDTLTLTQDFYNAGNVGIYALPYTTISFIHGTEDITQEISPYLELGYGLSGVDILMGTDMTVLLLTTTNSTNPAKVNINVKIKGELPNYLVKGGVQYWLNGNTSDVKIVLNTQVSAIQADNNSANGQDLEKQLLKLINPNAYQVNYTYSTNASTGETTLYADGKEVVLTSTPVDISTFGNKSVMAFPTTNTNGEGKLIIVANNNSDGVLDINSETNLGGLDISDLKEVEVGGGITTINSLQIKGVEEWDYNVIETITIGESVTTLNNIGYAPNLTTLNFYSNGKLTTIGSNVADGAYVNSVIIPKTVTSLGSRILGDGIGDPPSYIAVEEGNPVYHSKDNCIIETATNTLIWGTGFSKIPNYVETIRAGAFYYGGWPEIIDIPDSVTTIEEGAFTSWGAYSMNKVIVGTGITTVSDIYNGVFKENSLYSKIIIYTKHTSSNTFTVDMVTSTGYNNYPINVYYFSQNEPTSAGNYWHYDSDGITPVLW